MTKKQKRKRMARSARDAPQVRTAFVQTNARWLEMIDKGYKPLSQCPEVQACVGLYADLISSMTLHLMQNGDEGDVRIRNALSDKLDIDPHPYLTRHDLMWVITYTLLTEGNAYVLPKFRGHLLDALIPLEPSRVSTRPDGDSYRISYNGHDFAPDEVLHFRLRPNPDRPWEGMGYDVALRDVVQAIRQAGKTKQALLESPAPSIIVKVDGLTEEFADVEGRKALGRQYLDASETGQPWFIPAEAFAVEQVKPLTMADLAIEPNLTLDKRTICAILGVPPFAVGVGDYNREAYNGFVQTRVLHVAKIIEQELTSKLIWAQPWYLRLSARSLMAYAITDLANVGASLVDRMAMRRNELRDWVGLPPDKDMQEILGLENYLPADKLGEQKKLKDGGEDNGAPDKDGAGQV